MEPLIEKSKIQLPTIHDNIIPNIAPWTIQSPKILNLYKFQKTNMQPLNFQKEFKKIRKVSHTHAHLYRWVQT